MVSLPPSPAPLKPARPWLARQRGNVSLLIAAGSWVGILLAGRHGLLHGDTLVLARHISEGALVGGVADWFAVRALFRRIPVPLLQRHTNILIKNRPRMTEGIVDMVQNQWLAPAVIRERLQQISLTAMAVHHLQQPATRDTTLYQLRRLGQHALALLDSPVLVRFSADLASRHVQDIDLRRVLLRPLRDQLADDAVFAELWRTGCQLLRSLLQQPDVRQLVHVLLEQLISQYLRDEENKGVLSGTWARIKLWVGMPVASERQQWLHEKLDLLDGWLQQQSSQDSSSELAGQVRQRLLDVLDEVLADEGELPDILLRQQARLIERLRDSDIFARTLSAARHSGEAQLADPDSALARWLADVFDDALRSLQHNPALQQRLDQGLAALVVDLIEQNPDAIGATVRLALSPQRLSDAELIRQIEDKVGDDLQWIRVNGALVGGLMAGLLTALSLWGPGL